MAWSERQLAILREMGLTLWWPGSAPRELSKRSAAAPDAASASAPSSAPQAAPAAVVPRSPAAAPIVRTASPPASVANTASADAVVIRPHLNGIDQLDWPALREAVAQCTACELCKSRRQTVFGVGHAQAHWMIVGEAPGEQEDQQGEPFVGRAGQLLDHMLHAVGLTRAQAAPEQQVFIANVLKCRPPGNRNPTPQEVAQCEPYLKRQVQLVQPRIILAMGRFAVQSILQTSEPIGKLRGRVHRYADVPVVVSYHPAYLLRNPADKALAWDDLCLAREVLQTGPLSKHNTQSGDPI